MAGEFDDLIPNGGGTGAPAAAPPPAGGDFSDLVPAAPSPEQQRAERLRKIALGSLKRGGGEPGASDLFSDAYTLGLMKPVGALAGSLGGELGEYFGGEPATFGERWGAETGAYQDYLDEAKANSGWLGTGAEVAGSLTTGGPVVRQGVVPAIRQAIGMGAVEGAARNSEDIGSALTGGVKGGALAGGVATGLSGLARLMPGALRQRRQERLAERGVPPDELREQARAIYRQLDESGTAYSNTQADSLADSVRNGLRDAGYDPQGVHSSLQGVVARLEGLRGQPVSLETLQQIREQLGSNAGAMEPQVRRIAGLLMGNIDDLVMREAPALTQLPGDQVGPMWQQARRLWRSSNTAADIGWRVDKAERRAASTNSGQNTENAIRQNIRSVVDRATQPGRFNPYTPAEIAQMERTVRGSGAQNATRWLGNQLAGIPSTTVGGLGTMGTLIGATGIPTDPSTGLALTAAGLMGSAGMQGLGHLLKGQAANMAENEADTLMRLITTGSTRPMVSTMGPPARDTLARMLSSQLLTRGGGLSAAALGTGQ